MTPRISVVLPTWNRAACLGRAIGSVLGQSCAPLELIVVDDASDDATAASVRAFDDRRVKYVRREARGGAGAARNQGIGLAQGDYVAFQDSDDEWLPQKLERQVRALDQAPDAVLVVTNTSVTEGYPRALAAPLADGAVTDITALAARWLPGTPTWLARRAALQECGGFATDLKCHEDWDLGLRLARRGRIVLVNEALVLCRLAPGSLYADERARFESLRRIVERERAYLAGHDDAWSYYCNAVGQGEARFGSVRTARRWFRAALHARPLAPRTWLNLLASLGGRLLFERYVAASRHVMARAAALRHRQT